MRQLLLIISLLALWQTANCGDLSLEQLKDRLPYGIIPGWIPLGATRSLGCYLADNEILSPENLSPADKKRGAVMVWVHAFERSESSVDYVIEVRGSATLKPNTDYRIKGYESGEWITDPVIAARVVLRDRIKGYASGEWIKDATNQVATA